MDGTNNGINVNVDELAEALAARLSNQRGGEAHIGLIDGDQRREHPKPMHHGRVIHFDPKARSRRVQFDEEELEQALIGKGMAMAVRKVSDAPVEVKLVIAMLLGLKLDFEDIDQIGQRPSWGFDNPLVADFRVDAIAGHFGVGRERLAAEIGNAPDEMLAVLLATADLCLSGLAAVASSDDDPDQAA